MSEITPRNLVRARTLVSEHSANWGHHLPNPASWLINAVASAIGHGARAGAGEISDPMAQGIIRRYAPSSYTPLVWLVEAVQAGYREGARGA